MKFYKNLQDEVFALEVDGSQDHMITEDMQEISIHEVNRINKKQTTTTWDTIKKYRNKLLSESDWTDLPNSPVNNKPAWIRYRQTLRDITIHFKTPSEVVWPTKPI
jgi:hypothetical protein